MHRLLTLMLAVHMTAIAGRHLAVSCVLYAGLVPVLKSEGSGDAAPDRADRTA